MTENEVAKEYTTPSVSTGAPPPYSRSRSSILQLSNLRDPAAEESSKVSSLQLVMVTSSNDNWNSTPYECASVLEDRFLLLGYTEGIQVLDLNDSNAKPRTIIWVRARQMMTIESSRTVLILAGRYKQVRCYSLDALLRLVYGVLNLDWSQRRDRQFDVPYLPLWQQLASQSGKSPDEAPSNNNNMGLREIFGKRKEEKNTNSNVMGNHVALMGTIKPFYVCNNITYQDYYYKLPDSKDALSIHTYQTSTYIFAAIAHRDKIVLWQKKREHHIQPFYRLKVFWIPTEAKAVSFADDRITLRHIIAVFSNEATAIDLRDSKVETVPVDANLERIYVNTWVREQYEHQLGSPRSPNSPIPTLPTTSSSAFPTLPASFSVPPIQWTFLNQLPFYPDNLPATTLTTEYSIPPSYSTVITSLAPPDPVALPSAAAPQLFFATLGKQSYIVDLSGALFSTQVYRWTEIPNHIEFIQLEGDWCVVGFGPETVEIISIKSAQSIQRVMHGVPVKFLGRWDVAQGKKQEYKSLVWTCAASDRIHVYMLNK
ncbi:hypothetical protein K501DRAFT_254638 [Backusella circina FSU 941]|nr:hypothetical protein K501DRAFT_254638 [Backusella circina FSU 941]